MKYLKKINHVILPLLVVLVVVIEVIEGGSGGVGLNDTLMLNQLSQLLSRRPDSLVLTVHEQECKLNIHLKQPQTTQASFRQHYHLNKMQIKHLINSTTATMNSMQSLEQCAHVNLTIEQSSQSSDGQQSGGDNNFMQFLSNKSRIIVYFMFIAGVIVLTGVFIYWLATSRLIQHRNKKKRNLRNKSNQPNYFNPFDIIKMNDFTQNSSSNNNNCCKNMANNTNSQTALLQPSSTLDLNNSSRLDEPIVIDEGDTRSEYSITDIERMKYVKQWIESLS